jgi:hypothetical protein
MTLQGQIDRHKAQGFPRFCQAIVAVVTKKRMVPVRNGAIRGASLLSVETDASILRSWANDL